MKSQWSYLNTVMVTYKSYLASRWVFCFHCTSLKKQMFFTQTCLIWLWPEYYQKGTVWLSKSNLISHDIRHVKCLPNTLLHSVFSTNLNWEKRRDVEQTGKSPNGTSGSLMPACPEGLKPMRTSSCCCPCRWLDKAPSGWNLCSKLSWWITL